MSIRSNIGSFLLLIFILAAYITSASGRHRHIKLRHERHRRQHNEGHLPSSFILDSHAEETGRWGPWSAPSSCSRSCGGGVAYQTRSCYDVDRNQNPSCTGAQKKFFSCNIQDCPENAMDFRSEQCSEYNSVPFDGVYYNWTPYIGRENKCVLYCVPRGERVHHQRNRRVVDGTPCDARKNDVCVEGKCMPVGCDMMLGSNATEDRCRKCGGDGSGCKTLEGLLDMQDLTVGYNDILLIPSGATNIFVREVRPSTNYLAIRNSTGHYYLNGNWRIDSPRSLRCAGTHFHYTREAQDFVTIDAVTALGPTTEAIYIVLLQQVQNVGVRYEFSIPEELPQTSDPEGYTWITDEFSECSKTCGQGMKSRRVMCVKRSDNSPADENLCDQQLEPPSTEPCAEDPCPPRWTSSEWGPCNQKCGPGGERTREIRCEQIVAGGIPSVVDDCRCTETLGPKANETQSCNEEIECPQWHAGPWKPCNRLCGEGKQTRKITCFKKEDDKIVVLDDSECEENRPEAEKSCELKPCAGIDWITTDWSACDDKCGLAQQTRTAKCATINGEILPDEKCSFTNKPELIRDCDLENVCQYQWHATQWSECSAVCGAGIQTRKVFCGTLEDGRISIVDDGECDSAKKYNDTKECIGPEKECKGQWFAGPWSECSKPCNGGEKTRKVVCLKDDEVVSPEGNCYENDILSQMEDCDPVPCGEDEITPVEPGKEGLLKEDDEEECEEYEDDEFVAVVPNLDAGAPNGMDESKILKPTADVDDVDADSAEEFMLGDSPGGASGSGAGEPGSGDDEFGSSTDTTDSTPTTFADEDTSSNTSPIPTTVDDSRTTILPPKENGVQPGGSATDTYKGEISDDLIPAISNKEQFNLDEEFAETPDPNLKSKTSTEPSDVISSAVITDFTTSNTQESESDSTGSLASSTLGDSDESGATESSDQSTRFTTDTDTTEISESSDDTTIEDTDITEESTESVDDNSSTDSSLLPGNTDQELTSDSTGTGSETVPTDATASSDGDEEETTDFSLTSEDFISVTESTSASTDTDSTVQEITEVSLQTTDISSDTKLTDSSLSSGSTLQETTDISPQSTEASIDTKATDSSTGSSSAIDEITTVSSQATDSSTTPQSTSPEITASSSGSTEVSGDTTAPESSTESGSTVDESKTVSSQSTDSFTTPQSTSPEITRVSLLSTEVSGDTTAAASTTGSGSTPDEDATSSSESTDFSTTPQVTTSESSEDSSQTTEVSGDTTVTDSATSLDSTIQQSTDGLWESTETSGDTKSTGSTISSESITSEITKVSSSSTDTSSDTSPTDSSPTSASDLYGSTQTSEESSASSIESSKGSTEFSSTTDTTGSSDATEITTESSLQTTEVGLTTETSLETSETGLTTETGETTESGITEEDDDLDTTTQTHISEIWTTITGIESTIEKERKIRKCKPRKPKTCKDTKFGCCPDSTMAAKGPFGKGCRTLETCQETTFGCCPDEVSPAKGLDNLGCPDSHCEQTLFGCCPDNVTAAEGNDFEGCKELCAETEFGCCPDGETSASGDDYLGCCNGTAHGCCPDGITAATGPDNEGCEVESSTVTTSETSESTLESSTASGITDELQSTISTSEVTEYEASTTIFDVTEYDETTTEQSSTEQAAVELESTSTVESTTTGDCTTSEHGCCPDGITKASGPSYRGCNMPCETSRFGCCEDGITPAHGYNREGCCLVKPYGCCPDNIREARGPDSYGCGCQYSSYGCCPDNTTARGPDGTGCGCKDTTHGCCPDQYTTATGPKFEGCDCHTYQFGCCPDGVTPAVGSRNQGCGCQYSQFGCCPDDVTPAKGPNYDGCTCDSSKYGCCPDGLEEAQGENFEGCLKVPEVPGAICELPSDLGTCTTWTVEFFFDMTNGVCNRFWYGGCGGNGNRFKTMNECRDTCVQPKGRDACYLPKVHGRCKNDQLSWYYDAERKSCGQFIYGGCDGNANKFKTREDCEELCVDADDAVCEQPKESGPCEGNFTRWYFNKEHQTCEEFTYGGCKANKNNFPTRIACQQQCLTPGQSRVVRDVCTLEKEPGPCPGSMLRWYYDAKHETCRKFVYGGCKGNENKFRTRAACVQRCPVRDYCSEPQEDGRCTEKLARWSFNLAENRCMPFYYTGCGGNRNNFETKRACDTDCPPKIEQDTCYLPAVMGECTNYTERWYYDSYQQYCRQFWYGGCNGNGNNFRTEDECKHRCEPTATTLAPVDPFNPASCLLPNDSGPCDANLAKWYYDSRTGVCTQFIYGGCSGNANKFDSAEQCEDRCGNVQDLCTLPPIPGPCRARFRKYYYDTRTDSCHEFPYGGCQGNKNNFDDKEGCEKRCKKAQAIVLDPTTTTTTTTTTETPAPQTPAPRPVVPPISSTCLAPMDPGPCRNDVAAYYYDPRTQTCQAFIYGGCGGNANRFLTLEQCERLCGKYRGQDACSLQPDPGRCTVYHVKYYYDTRIGRCSEFGWGGCDGNANRFSTIGECESVCLHHEEPEVTGSEIATSTAEICSEPVDTGTCASGQYKRFYFDPERQTCTPFVYTGCGGNRNNFKSFDYCIRTCSPHAVLPNPDDDNSIESPGPCERAREECSRIHCPYGKEIYVDENDCQRCQCADPCRAQSCPQGTRCAITLDNRVDSTVKYRTICRSILKPGLCPRLSNSTVCDNECQTDADCAEDHKCCQTSCGTSCLKPVPSRPVVETPVFNPVLPNNRIPATIEAPKEPKLYAEVGNYVTMPCVTHGNPRPIIQWRRSGILIDNTVSRHHIDKEGMLQIIDLGKSDAGIYTCTANNGLVAPVKIQYELEITAPRERPSHILGKPGASLTVTLNSPVTLECWAIGWPRPDVIWWHEERVLPLSDGYYQQLPDHSLRIHSVTLTRLGHYTCQAYNALKKPASWTIILQAVGPIQNVAPENQIYTKYLVRPPQTPVISVDVLPERNQRPEISETPVHPSQSELSVTTHATVTRLPPVIDTPYVFRVPLKVNVSMTQATVYEGAEINIPCTVDGYPNPRVLWYKDDVILETSDRIRISELHRLYISNASVSDSGKYKCAAANTYESTFDAVDITVTGIDPSCRDNPFLADCHLIVASKYCTHQYYSVFCCRSCTEAGQIPARMTQSNEIGRRKRFVLPRF